MDENRKLAFCPRCGNRAPQKLIHTQECSEVDWVDWETCDVPGRVMEEQVDVPVTYFVATCETCDGILVYNAIAHSNFHHSELVWPSPGELHKSVPKSVTTIYNEALRIKTLAPNAFAVQIRRALEALCKDRGTSKGPLQRDLKELADRGEIPATLAEVTDVLRLLGNVGAHAAEESVRPWQVNAIDEFFRAVAEYVYVAPSKLKEFRESLSIFKTKKDAENEGDV